MSITPEQFAQWAQVEKHLKEQEAATGTVVTEDTLRGCLMAAVSFAARLNLPQADFSVLAKETFESWNVYGEVKKRLVAKKKKG